MNRLETCLALILACMFQVISCGRQPEPSQAETQVPRPPLLLVTLDTTRGDRVGYAFPDVKTPNLDRLAEQGIRFDRAYTTVPMTLPAHTSMMTGTYASQHSIHENARYLEKNLSLLATHLKHLGYTNAAFVSAYSLAAEFGLSRDFDVYDDTLPAGQTQKPGSDATDRALAFLEKNHAKRLFLWVHYFDPHAPYTPPEPFKTQYPDDPYLGEIAFMDAQLGRLLDAFESRYAGMGFRILVVGDHGEGLGDHGEMLHGNLLYEGCMRVPLVIAGSGIESSVRTEPISTRRIFHTFLDWAGDPQPLSLMHSVDEIVLGEAMKPFLQYGWQPQVMAVDGPIKVIRTSALEVYDVTRDPQESDDLVEATTPSDACMQALDAYPIPGVDEPGPELTQEQQEKLAGLGYLSSGGIDARRFDGPDPKDMTHLFADLDLGSGLFIKERYAEAVEVFDRIFRQDPGNLMVCLRLAVAHSLLDHGDQAEQYFDRAMDMAPESLDTKHYLAMHEFRLGRTDDAADLFRQVLEAMPNRLPALECMARIARDRGRLDEAVIWMNRVIQVKGPQESDLLTLGDLNMARGDTAAAIDSFERARALSPPAFDRNLELGVCYLAVRRFEEARACLDQVLPSHPEYPLALFKRAQVSVLLHEGDAADKIQAALEASDETSRALILGEPLFEPYGIR